jgi:hypothetical protein
VVSLHRLAYQNQPRSFFEIAIVLVRFDHVAIRIVKANHTIVRLKNF